MATRTLKDELTRADPNNLADALRKVNLGTLLEVVEYDTGTITAAASITLPGEGALCVQSVRVVTGTAAVGERVLGDSGTTPAQFGTSGVYKCSVSADGKTITFEANVTRVFVRYVRKPATALTSAFNNG